MRPSSSNEDGERRIDRCAEQHRRDHDEEVLDHKVVHVVRVELRRERPEDVADDFENAADYEWHTEVVRPILEQEPAVEQSGDAKQYAAQYSEGQRRAVAM